MNEDNRNTLKEISDSLRMIAGTPKRRKTAAIIVAAGSGVRMQSETPKQFLSICGMPVIVHTVRAYCASCYIDRIVLVIRPEDETVYREYIEKYRFEKPIQLVFGDETRQKSVLCGIEALNGSDTAFVAIADGVRPLITPGQIDTVCLTAYRFMAASAGCPSVDTVKIVNDKGNIESTPDRNSVWNASTPQVFDMNLYRAAAYACLEENITVTDDNALVEHIGHAVRMVDCGKFNLKITLPEDLILAEAILKNRACITQKEVCDVQNR